MRKSILYVAQSSIFSRGQFLGSWWISYNLNFDAPRFLEAIASLGLTFSLSQSVSHSLGHKSYNLIRKVVNYLKSLLLTTYF